MKYKCYAIVFYVCTLVSNGAENYRRIDCHASVLPLPLLRKSL